MRYIIEHRPEKHRFETEVEHLKAYVEYLLLNGEMDLVHTIVPKPLEGRGIAGDLVQAAFDYARREGLKIRTTCSYTVVWARRHPEYADVLVGE